MNGSPKRLGATGILVALAMLLTGCFVTPGKFDSTLVLNADNSFSYSYSGEIFVAALNPKALAGGTEPAFDGGKCYTEDTFEERECTAEEVAEQRADWEERQAVRQSRDEREAAKFASMLGGIDPNDPDAGRRIAEKLERQRGWNSVSYAGEGLFNVEYAIDGRLTHDLVFPVMEGLTAPSPFLQVVLRDDNTVRVNAPGFAMNESDGSFSGMIMGQFMADMSGTSARADPLSFPTPDGTFRIITDGQILANNTDEGPVASGAQQALNWRIVSSNEAAPTALIKLGS